MEHYTKPEYARNLFVYIKYKDYPILHDHSYWEFMLIMKGTIIHKINGEKREVEQNKLCLIRPSDVHSIHNKRKLASQHLNLGIDSNYFKNVLDLIEGGLYERLLAEKGPIEIPLSPAKADRLFHDAYKILAANQDCYEMHLSLLFLDVVREFYSHLIKQGPIRSTYSPSVSQLILIMNNPENMKKELAELIKETNYSYSHINRIFLHEVGCTPSQFFREKKFEYAKILISDTDISLTDIACAVGYENYPHFSTAFKNYTGVTPCAFGRNNRTYYQNAAKKIRD